MKITKSLRFSKDLITMIEDYGSAKGSMFNKTIVDILEKHLLGQTVCKAKKVDKFIEHYSEKLESLSQENKDLKSMNFSMIEELKEMREIMMTFKLLLILIGRNTSEGAEKEIQHYFPNLSKSFE